LSYRNRKLLDLARGQACVMCGARDDTIVAAHSNLGEHGKGMGLKADDCMSAWLCMSCHSEYDQGHKMNRVEKRDFILTAICKTYQELWIKGLIGVNE
jgi:hypothetical protein